MLRSIFVVALLAVGCAEQETNIPVRGADPLNGSQSIRLDSEIGGRTVSASLPTGTVLQQRSCEVVKDSLMDRKYVSNEDRSRCKEECLQERGDKAKRIVHIRDIVTACQKYTHVRPSGDSTHNRVIEEPTGKLRIIPPTSDNVVVVDTNEDCLKSSKSNEYPYEIIQDVRHNWMNRMPDDADIVYCMELYDSNLR